ncbi:hypothetical protein JQU17_14505 [Ponticoccus sp. SC2-23]|uniref:hypothetical protein n=1 Tax=Alexandriicola marinus TaxID=2081710 RepID=UPI00193B200E|nr:hypothetical protein [Alexandriicola marinus]MBM1221918.1 hypothetical protein [Ponticoccus sp. SC6-9]MBM1226269.1 hypothetical protein [Ponticoccus sp. SC6-15]MBM1230865.1 hypothetical protein [Ponticoccus sp. SC6-38]MBM1235294.1 hypothetical protein [Ponticoccus sp. SC6-45]MBM1239887.1 hypothetical protein [Ponticoccus sp. SC6-49]MBM1244031.1 hypothetical protein [Ponticoccus sp. SC2-64]MBM1248818.1 hypothetical protein [Ponticoccus sp. SC6-42]MBM1253542.1 hypothetical protein [Pontico
MSDPDTNHFCPGCGVSIKHFPRYPWHFCNSCRETATDREGHRYRFGNISLSGGFEFGLDGSDERFSCLGVICLIKGRPAYIHEARFGGIVAEPVPDLPFRRKGVVDIRRGIPQAFVDEERARQEERRQPRIRPE